MSVNRFLTLAALATRRLLRLPNRLLAEINAWQYRSAAEAHAQRLVTAKIVLVSDLPKEQVRTDLQAAGWVVERISKNAEGYRATIRGRIAFGSTRDVVKQSLANLQFALAEHELELVDLQPQPQQPVVIDRWYVSATREARTDERQKISGLLRSGRSMAGDEAAVRKRVADWMDESGIPGTAWEMRPANASAALDNHSGNPVARLLATVIVLSAAGAIVGAIFGPHLPETELMPIAKGDLSRSWAIIWLFVLVLLGVGVVLAVENHRVRNGYRIRPVDVVTLATWGALTYALGGVVAARFTNSTIALVVVLGGPCVLATLILFLRPSFLRARVNRRARPWSIVVGVTAVIIVLNVPVSAFLYGAGIPELIGSMPIGTVLHSGLPAALILGTAAAAAATAVRSFRRRPWIRPAHVAATLAVTLLLSWFGLVVALAYQHGTLLGEHRAYSEDEAFGLAEICTTSPFSAKNEHYWLVGTAGRTSYLVSLEIPHRDQSIVRVDSNQQLTYTPFSVRCTSK